MGGFCVDCFEITSNHFEITQNQSSELSLLLFCSVQDSETDCIGCGEMTVEFPLHVLGELSSYLVILLMTSYDNLLCCPLHNMLSEGLH